MKVILACKSIYPFHPYGGVQKYVYNYAKFLVRVGVDVEIVAPLDDGVERSEVFQGIKYRLLKPSIYRYLEYPIGWLGVHLFSRSLARYLQKTSFDILHSFDMTGYQYLKVRNRKPVITHTFTDNFLSNPISLTNPRKVLNLTASQFEEIKKKKVMISPFCDGKTKRRFFAQYYFKVKPMYFCFSQSDLVFFEDESFVKDVNEAFQLEPKKSAVLPVGVDVKWVQQQLKSSKGQRSDFDLNEKDFILMTVNRLAADKGVDKIVEALGEIIKEIPQAKLIIVGSGYQEKELYQLITQKNLKSAIRHLKNVSEEKLIGLYKLADLYVCAFSYPGSSLSTLEAMAAGLPIITTAQKWLVEDNQNGIWLDDNQAALIQQAVIELFRGHQMRSKGALSQKIVQQYDWPQIVSQGVKHYSTLIAGKDRLVV